MDPNWPFSYRWPNSGPAQIMLDARHTYDNQDSTCVSGICMDALYEVGLCADPKPITINLTQYVHDYVIQSRGLDTTGAGIDATPTGS